MLDSSPTRPHRGSWDDGSRRDLRPQELLLYRSNLLGSDKRVTNYGGGNTSSKIAMTDPLTGETVEVLWVKGSGGDIGSMKLDGFSTLYMDKLKASPTAMRGLEMEDAMVGYLSALHLQPQSARDLDRHAAARPMLPLAHVDHVHPDAIIAIAASAELRALTQEIFGDEIGWLPWRRPGFELGLWLQRFAAENPQREGRDPRGARPVHLGRDAARVLRTTVGTINRAIACSRDAAGRAAFGGAKIGPAATRESAARIAAALMPRLRGLDLEDRRKIGHFDDQRGGARIRRFAQMLDALAPLGTVLPGPFPAHQDPPARARLRPASEIGRRYRRAARAGDRDLSRGLRRLLRALQAAELAGDARSEPGRVSRPGRRDDHLRRGQGDGAHRGRVLCQRDQRDARRIDASRPIAACRSRRPSTSSTGCSRRRSCSGCRSRRALAGRVALRHRRRRRHRQRHRGAAAARGRLRRARRYRRRSAGRRASTSSASAFGKDNVRGVDR